MEVFQMRYFANGGVRLQNVTEWYASSFAELHDQYHPRRIYFFAELIT